jgi:hypothetical protein
MKKQKENIIFVFCILCWQISWDISGIAATVLGVHIHEIFTIALPIANPARELARKRENFRIKYFTWNFRVANLCMKVKAGQFQIIL